LPKYKISSGKGLKLDFYFFLAIQIYLNSKAQKSHPSGVALRIKLFYEFICVRELW
jgi:hypothetical protein